MSKRSLQAAPARIPQAKRTFAIKEWTQENPAGEVNLKTRQPIWRFFTGKPIDRQVFMEICSILDLDWREIADNPPAEFAEAQAAETVSGVDQLVQQVRAQRRDPIQQQCGILRSRHTCLCCSGILLRHVRLDGIYWRCLSCHADMPV